MTEAGAARLDSRAPNALDGLRGLAALMVVASHAGGLGLHLLPGFSLAGIGKYGVYLFFVLSAYLLTAQWLSQFARPEPPGWQGLWRYGRRRVLRVFPLYLPILLLGWALAPRGLGVPLDGPAVLRHVLLLEGRDLYWSIPVEFVYYLWIPPLAWLLARHTQVALALVLLAAAAALLCYSPAQMPVNSDHLGYYLPVFLTGSLSAWLLRHRAAPDAVPAARVTLADGLLLLGLLLSVPQALRLLGLAVRDDVLHAAVPAWGLAWSLVLAGLVTGRLPAWRWCLSRSWMAWSGRACFALYLLHMPALYLARKLPLASPLQAWLGLGLACGLAALAHRWIERPARALGR